jgi:hypothetical protein
MLDEDGDAMCALYDLTMSITHEANMVSGTRCAHIDSHLDKGDEIPSIHTGLPKQIRDHDLDDNGEYHFEKLMKFVYPKDFKDVEASAEHRKKDGSGMDVLGTNVLIDMSHNFDIGASIEAEFDEALYTMALTEVVRAEDRDYYSEYVDL